MQHKADVSHDGQMDCTSQYSRSQQAYRAAEYQQVKHGRSQLPKALLMPEEEQKKALVALLLMVAVPHMP